jgi:hypothetical protein
MERRYFQHTKRKVSLRYWEFRCGCGSLVWISAGEIKREPYVKGCSQCHGTGLTLIGRVKKGYTPSDSCWLWTGALNAGGYGIISGFVEGKKKSLLAHRIVLEKKLGRPILKGFGALHNCNNPPCGNPGHLYEGTQIDNMRDRDEAGNTVKGENKSSAKLKEDDIRNIKTLLFSNSPPSLSDLARQYGVGHTTISNIANNKKWKHIT